MVNKIKQILTAFLTRLFLPKSKKISLEELVLSFPTIFLHKGRSVYYPSKKYKIIPTDQANDFFWLQLYQQRLKLNDAYYSILPNVFVSYPHGVQFSAERSVIMTSVRNRQDYLVKSGGYKFRVKNSLKDSARVYGYAISAVDLLGRNYYHFLIDVLSFFDCYWHFQQNNSTPPKVIIAQNAPDFQVQWLKILGVKEEGIIVLDQNIKVENLIVPSSRITSISLNKKNQFTYLLDPDSIFWLREFVFKRFPANTKTKKIYISRERVKTRQIYEEEKLLEQLYELGFEKVVLEDLSVLEQVELFRSATHVISAHGAALTNMIFADNCHLIELFPVSRYKDSASIYFQITEILDCKHDLVLCEEMDDQETLKVSYVELINILENE